MFIVANWAKYLIPSSVGMKNNGSPSSLWSTLIHAWGLLCCSRTTHVHLISLLLFPVEAQSDDSHCDLRKTSFTLPSPTIPHPAFCMLHFVFLTSYTWKFILLNFIWVISDTLFQLLNITLSLLLSWEIPVTSLCLLLSGNFVRFCLFLPPFC